MTYDLFEVEHVQDVTLVRLDRVHLDSPAEVDELRDELESLIGEEHPSKMLVSFCRVPTVTSQAIGALLEIRDKIDETGGAMKLCEMHPAIRNAFTVLDLEGTMFPIHEGETEAINDFRKNPR